MVILIEKVVKVRRCLTLTRHRYTTKNNSIGANYYRLRKGGVKEVVIRMGKRNVSRVKKENTKSNHPREWDYVDNGRIQRYKCAEGRYGGTRVNGKTFFRNGEWYNRKLCVVN